MPRKKKNTEIGAEFEAQSVGSKGLDAQKTEKHESVPTVALPKDNRVRIMPLGGLGEIGMNMTLFHYNKVMFAIDCGQMLPDEEQLGVDMVIPDFEFVGCHADMFKAVILTHAHEDHIGALPIYLPNIRFRFTALS